MSLIQDEAMAAVTRTWIEATFKPRPESGVTASWDKGKNDVWQYRTEDPTNPGSGARFVIYETGKWERGIGGSGNQGTVIDLLAKRDKLTLDQAAAKILGRTVEGIKATRKAGKVKAVVPIPADKIKTLQTLVQGTQASATHGQALQGTWYRRADNEVAFAVMRYISKGEVTLVPYFWGEDSDWHEGYAMETGRPLLNVQTLVQAPREIPVLLVATERDAKIEVPGHIVVTWAGGAKDFVKTDWSPLDGHPLTIWAGRSSTAAKNRFPDALVLDLSDKPEDWSLADAHEAGIDLLSFLDTCPKIGGPGGPKTRPDDGFPFLCLGYDKDNYYFLPRRTRVIRSIPAGVFRNAQMLELAPLSWWGAQALVTDQASIKQAPAQEMLLDLQHRTGFFDQMKLRGTGVWREASGIVLNDGAQILTMDGKMLDYDDFPSTFNYVPSRVKFGVVHGHQSTDADGRKLEALFLAQDFQERSMGVLLMGWSLLCCFGSVLTWRPHGWVTGGSQTGKGWLYENMILPLAGPYAHIGSGKDTEAGTRWALDQDPRPAIMSETEPNTERDRLKLQEQITLARNSSDDTSGYINISQAGGGTKGFHLRSMFLFQSIRVPEGDRAINGRFIMFELRSGKDVMEIKKHRSKELLDGGLLDDPGRFRRRIFHALPRIIADIEYIRSHYRGAFSDQRAVDQVAPLLAAAWAVQSSRPVSESGVWIENWVTELATDGKRLEDDEDAFMRILLGTVLKTDENKGRTVAELLRSAAGNHNDPNGSDDARGLLERYGLGLKRPTLTSRWELCISTNSVKLAELFAKTPYASGYGAQVRRHPMAQGGKGVHKTLAGVRVRCQVLDWDGFRALYLDEVEESGDAPF